ncbi:unnamed protein product [Linum trigynum]|uniref:Uncharacterized protein n=1 Tax=Linum trigynum TaxID=586398 RepID=A0AAV2GR60_9ROSI
MFVGRSLLASDAAESSLNERLNYFDELRSVVSLLDGETGGAAGSTSWEIAFFLTWQDEPSPPQVLAGSL